MPPPLTNRKLAPVQQQVVCGAIGKYSTGSAALSAGVKLPAAAQWVP
jgi:hypothetical protein